MDDEHSDRDFDRLLRPLIEGRVPALEKPTDAAGRPRAAFYARRSITDPEYDSIGIQLDKASGHCETVGAHCDLRRHVYVDRHRSGRTMTGRSGLAKLLAAIAEGSLDIVVVKGVDRITRSHRDAVMLDEYFRLHRISLHIAGHGPVDDMTLILGGYQSQKDHDAICGRLLEARGAANRAGKLIGAYRKYGYDRTDEHPFLTINEEQAAVVRRAFAEMEAGITPAAVARGLNRDGVPSPRGGTWSHLLYKGSPLADPILKGLYVSHDEKGRIEIPVPTLKIIEPDMFDRIVDRYPAVPRVPHKLPPTPFVTPEIRCRCGSRITPARNDHNRCAECRSRRFDGGCSTGWELRTGEIARRILRFVLDELLDPDRSAEWQELRRGGLERLHSAYCLRRDAITEEIDAIDRRMDADPDLGCIPGSLDAGVQRHRLELRQVQLSDALASNEQPSPDPASTPEADAELRDAIGRMLLQLPRMRFDTVDRGVVDRLRSLVPRVVVETDDAGERYDLRFLVGIPGVREPPYRRQGCSDPRWVTRSFPRPSDGPLDFPEVVLAHHEQGDLCAFDLSDHDWIAIWHLFGPCEVFGCDPRLVAEAMYFIEVTKLNPSLLPERYEAVTKVVKVLNATPIRNRMLRTLRRRGTEDVRKRLGRPHLGRRAMYAAPID